jgi:hypothetical protein
MEKIVKRIAEIVPEIEQMRTYNAEAMKKLESAAEPKPYIKSTAGSLRC